MRSCDDAQRAPAGTGFRRVAASSISGAVVVVLHNTGAAD